MNDSNRYPYQYPARGIAVSGFVFSLAHLFTFGIFPPLAALGIIFSIIAFLKGNRQSVTFLGFAFGLSGVVLSIWVTLKLGGYIADPAAFQELFADASSAASSVSSAVSSSVSSISEAVSSVSEGVSSAAG